MTSLDEFRGTLTLIVSAASHVIPEQHRGTESASLLGSENSGPGYSNPKY